MVTPLEITAIKASQVFFTKEGIMEYLKEQIETSIDEKDKAAYERLLEKTEKKEIECIPEKWDDENFDCYYLSGEMFSIMKAKVPVKSMEFSYDNSAHELYLLSFTIIKEEVVVE